MNGISFQRLFDTSLDSPVGSLAAPELLHRLWSGLCWEKPDVTEGFRSLTDLSPEPASADVKAGAVRRLVAICWSTWSLIRRLYITVNQPHLFGHKCSPLLQFLQKATQLQVKSQAKVDPALEVLPLQHCTLWGSEAVCVCRLATVKCKR